MKSQPKNESVLLVVTQGVWGGAQRYVYDLSRAMSSEISVSVAFGKPFESSDLREKLKNYSIPFFQLRHLQRAINPYRDIAAIFELRRLYKNLQPSAVHLNSSKAGIIGSLAGFGLPQKPRIVYTVHGWVFREPLNWAVKKLYLLLEKWTAPLKDAIIVLSPEEKADAVEILKIPAKKIKHIPLAIEKPRFLPAAEARQTILNLAGISHCSGSLVGTIANLYSNKGIDVLIEAAELVTKIFPDTHFFVIGSGPEESALKKIIAEKKITTVHLLKARENAAELLRGFDLFVLPSRKEGMPYTILEAAYAGLPIVATEVGGLPSFSKQYESLDLVPPNNPEMLARTIIKKLNEKNRSPYGDRQAETHSSFQFSKMISETLTAYSSAEVSDSQ